jgi:D-glycero-alpha-D-manno-heptose 1-phosphate guanylyltransferase
VQFTEKQTRDCGLVNGGVYVFSRDIVANAPTRGVSLEKDIFPVLVPRGIYAMPVRGYFVDIGIPEEYKRLQGDAKNWIERLALPKVGGGTC